MPHHLLHARVRTHHHMNARHQVRPVLPLLILWRRIMQRLPSCARAIDSNLVHAHCLSNLRFSLLLTQESHSNGIIWSLRKRMRIPSRTAHSLNHKPCSHTQVSRFGAAPWTPLRVVIAPKAPHQGARLTIAISIIRRVHPHNSPLRLPKVQALATEAPRLGVPHRLNGMSCRFRPPHRTTLLNLPLGWCQSPIQHSSLSISRYRHKPSHPP